MDISKLSTSELLAELKSRSEKPNTNEHILVFGTIGIKTIGTNNSEHFIEVFKEIHSEKDFIFLKNASLRARFNPDRYYQGFYFKTDKFKELKQHLDTNNASFAKWIKSSGSVQYLSL